MTHLAGSFCHRRPVLAAALVALAAGCSDPADQEDVAVDEASYALASSMDLVGLSNSFEASPLLGVLPVSLARPRLLGDVRGALLASVGNRLCVDVETVDREDAAYVSVTYDQCPAGLLWLVEIDGALRADLEIETAPCSTGECPSAIRFRLSTEYLRIGSRLGTRFTELRGSWELYDPIAAGLATEWDSVFSVRNHLRRSLAVNSHASWLVEAGCVTLSIDADLTVAERQDLETIAVSAREVTTCRNQCPSSGEVQIAYGLGEILRWAYTGANTAVVTGPRGRRFEIALPCGDE